MAEKIADREVTLGEVLEEEIARVKKGGTPKYHEEAKKTGKLFVRERLALLLDCLLYTSDAADE